MKTLILFLQTIAVFSQPCDSILNSPRLEIRHFIAPASLISTGLLFNGSSTTSLKNRLKDFRNDKLGNFRTHVDDVLLFCPLAIGIGDFIFKHQSKTDLRTRSIVFATGNITAIGLTNVLKNAVKGKRPDNSTNDSFPSGHTSVAFATATYFAWEYKEKVPWSPALFYGLASVVGLGRIANNRHYLSDVLFGAGLGILSMRASYWSHKIIAPKKKRRVQRF
jgi:membrane-associated phospholipid phosphatase